MKNQYGISLISLIITIIVIIILATIVLTTGTDTTGRAQLSAFSNNFSQYSEQVQRQLYELQQTLVINNENANLSQLYYMEANGIKSAAGNSAFAVDPDVYDRSFPVGYTIPGVIKEIYNIKDNNVVAYVIDDYNITNYSKPNLANGSAGYEFYGDSNGAEYHFITSNGHVFTLPGYAFTNSDKTVNYYVGNENGAYYVASSTSGKPQLSPNVNGDVIQTQGPITALNLVTESLIGKDSLGNLVTSYSNSGEAIGRRTVIKY